MVCSEVEAFGCQGSRVKGQESRDDGLQTTDNCLGSDVQRDLRSVLRFRCFDVSVLFCCFVATGVGKLLCVSLFWGGSRGECKVF